MNLRRLGHKQKCTLHTPAEKAALPCIFFPSLPSLTSGLQDCNVADLGIIVETEPKGEDPAIDGSKGHLAKDGDDIHRQRDDQDHDL